MQALQCDRCFSYYTENKDPIIPGFGTHKIMAGFQFRAKDTDYNAMKDYDLCDKCAKEMIEWFQFRREFAQGSDSILS